MTTAAAGFDMVATTQSLNAGLDTVSNQITTITDSLASNPSPSEADMLELQAMMSLYSTLINMESSIIKTNGDALKQVAMNMGS